MEINKDLRQKATDYSMDSIKYICNNFGAREPGSKAERDSSEYLAKDIANNNWADTIEYQDFPVAARAFMGFSKLIPILIWIGTLLFWFVPYAPVILNISGLGVLVMQFLLYKQFLDPFYKKTMSTNMIASKKPTGDIKRRIILSGHIDAAYEWTLFHKFGAWLHLGGQVVAVVFCITSIVFSIVFTATQFTPLWAKILNTFFAFGYLPLFFFSNYNVVVPGANDNLTGCLAAVATIKYLKEANIEFENTEVICLVMGSEEAGLRGAKAYAKQFHDVLTDPKIETVFLGLETFRDLEHMSIYERDLTGLVKHDARVVKLLDKAVARFYDKPIPHASVYCGATDSAAMTQAGIVSGALAAMDPAPARYYHTRNDNADNLSPTCFNAAMDIIIAAVDIFDKEGLNQ